MTLRYSDRGHLLVWTGNADHQIVTVELYEKWYDLYLVAPDGTVTEVSFGDLEDPRYCEGDQTAVSDHVPNPVVVAAYAQANEYDVDNLAIELIVGRWEISIEENYF